MRNFEILQMHMRCLFQSYYEQHRRPLLVDYVAQELAKRERIVCENERWLAVVPYWAVWPFETMLLPKRHVQRLADLNEACLFVSILLTAPIFASQ